MSSAIDPMSACANNPVSTVLECFASIKPKLIFASVDHFAKIQVQKSILVLARIVSKGSYFLLIWLIRFFTSKIFYGIL